MSFRSLARAVAALLTGLVFVTANTAPVVCAAVHHGQRVAAHESAHHQHGSASGSDAHGVTAGATPADAPPCTDMSHCGVAVHGVTAAVTTLRVAAAQAGTLPVGPAVSAHTAVFSPLTPPPRA